MRFLLSLCVSLSLGCRADTKSFVEPSSEGQITSDADGDGYLSDEDCDEDDPSINPGEIEVCDGLDNNCDGNIDEGVSSTFYIDSDGDGFGDESTTIQACEAPDGYVPNANDCDHNSDEAYPGATEFCDQIDNNCDGEIDENIGNLYYLDSDLDGYGTEEGATFLCEIEDGYSTEIGDCDDNNNTVFPGAAEVCDELDNDCDGEFDEDVGSFFYADTDGDGFGDPGQEIVACSAQAGSVENNWDCNDADSEIFPGAVELCDGVDNNCDEEIDGEGSLGAPLWYADADGDGYGDLSSILQSCDQPTGYVDNYDDCNDADSSVSGSAVWYLDYDGDGYGDDAYALQICQQPAGYVSDNSDCNDADPLQNPTTEWYLDVDGDGYGANVSVTQCEALTGFVMNDSDCDDTEELAYTGAIEVCDEVDNDCNGSVDENVLSYWYLDIDGDGYGDDATEVEGCEAPTSYYVEAGGDCDDEDADISPGATEGCEDLDLNCDGSIDNDGDGDGYSDTTCGGSDCDDSDATVTPEQGGGCAVGQTCLDILNNGKSTGDGLYNIDVDGYDVGSDPFEVYCDMTTDSGGWTLIESYDISNRSIYYYASFFDYDLPRNQSSFNWDDYRLDLASMLDLFDLSTEFHARCHRTYSSSMDDYIFADINLMEQDYSAYTLYSNSTNPHNITCKVRGYSCSNYAFRWWHGTSGSYNWHAGFDVSSYLPGSVSSEDSFTWHEGALNSNHLCHTSAGDIVWMVR